MKLGILFSGGKDSAYAAYLAKKQGHELKCLITIISKNPESYMFHTPSIKKTKYQAKAMDIPVIFQKTKGIKEEELQDLEKAIKLAIKKYKIQGIVTGALQSVYQTSRIKKICEKLNIICLNLLWEKNRFQYLNELIKNNFKVIITSVSAYPLDESWLGREINEEFIRNIKEFNDKYKIHPAGEGGEFETFVIGCPLFKKRIKILSGRKIWKKDSGEYIIEKLKLI